jgi:hypothetical protein
VVNGAQTAIVEVSIPVNDKLNTTGKLSGSTNRIRLANALRHSIETHLMDCFRRTFQRNRPCKSHDTLRTPYFLRNERKYYTQTLNSNNNAKCTSLPKLRICDVGFGVFAASDRVVQVLDVLSQI